MKKFLKITGSVIIIFIIISWVAGIVIAPEKNPSKHYRGVILSQEADAILKVSCFDCHSNETVWPWYASLPPASALINFDVAKGRKVLNFSNWDEIPADKKQKILKGVWKSVEHGFMPFPPYLILHSEASLSQNDKDLLQEQVQKATF